MLGKNGVKSLDESFREVGLDSGKVLGEIDRMSGLMEARAKHPGAGGPPVPGTADPKSVENRNLYEHGKPPVAPGRAPAGGGSRRVVITMAEQARRELKAAGTDPAANQEEALKIVKKKRHTAAEKLAARLGRKKRKGKLRMASKLYRKRNKRKIILRAKKKIAKFGRAVLAKLHKAGKRIMMSTDQDLANLREDLNKPGTSASAETSNQFEESAYNAGLLSLYIGEVFESLGDKESAETMFTLSDTASDLAGELEKLGESEMSDGQEERLRSVLGQTVKALKVWEGFGSPTLFQALEARLAPTAE